MTEGMSIGGATWGNAGPMLDARRLGLIRRFRIVFVRVYDLHRCYRHLGRHVRPHRGCVRRWVA